MLLRAASAACRMTPSHDFMAGAVLLKHVSICEEVSQKTLVLEVWIFSQNLLVLEVRTFSFRGSLTESLLVPLDTASRMLPRSPFHKRHRGHCFNNVNEGIVSRMRPQSPLQECDRSHRFKRSHSFKKVTASRMLPHSPFRECDRSHRFKNVTAATASRMLPQSPLFKTVTAVTVSRM